MIRGIVARNGIAWVLGWFGEKHGLPIRSTVGWDVMVLRGGAAFYLGVSFRVAATARCWEGRFFSAKQRRLFQLLS